MSEQIATGAFTPEDLVRFASSSGDWNPIHTDAVAARRTIAGQIIVHGMLTLLWALEQHVATQGALPKRIVAFFRQTIHPQQQLTLQRERIEDGTRLSIASGGVEAASFLLTGQGGYVRDMVGNHRPARKMPLDSGGPQVDGLSGQLALAVDARDVQTDFPQLVAAWGIMPVATIMAFSTVVGMYCPGLHSLFTGIDVSFNGPRLPELDWSLQKSTSSLAPLAITVSGGAAQGRLSAFVRPAPVQQPTMKEIAGAVSPHEFAGQRALVIGGSRGLGELTAKLLAAGGADVLMTYRSGAEDAARVVADIKSAGGLCEAMVIDAAHPEMLSGTLKGRHRNSLFFFATPRISRQDAKGYQTELYAQFNAMYSLSFERIVRLLSAQSTEKVWALYPSTVYVDAPPPGFAEYADAKKQAEELCTRLNSELTNFHAMIERFPRMMTDQTLSLIPQKSEASLPLVLRAIRRLNTLMTGKM
jgi:hypothetical protein